VWSGKIPSGSFTRWIHSAARFAGNRGDGQLRRYEVVDAEADGSIQLIGSKYNTQDDIITESPDVVGPGW
jgi:hypothetical protein